MTAVSVGLPVYNGQRFLRACLDSLLAQSHHDFELIISDNGSTDDSLAIVEEYAAGDSRIRFERASQNRGAAWNHRRVLSLARGRYFKWCGADDRCHPDFLRTCIGALERERGAVLAFPKTAVIDEDGNPVGQTDEHLPLDSPDVVQRFSALMSAFSITHNPFYGVMHRATLERAGPMGAFLASDRCLLGRLALLGRFVEVPEYLLFRRRHAGNMRNQTDEQRFFNPATAETFQVREWRVLLEHVRAGMRAPFGIPTRLRLLAAVAGWTVKQRVDLVSEARGFLRRLVGRTLRRRAA